MSEKDFLGFVKKVEQLNLLLASVNSFPKRKELLISCTSHDEVVKLARSWGFEIGRQWGGYD